MGRVLSPAEKSLSGEPLVRPAAARQTMGRDGQGRRGVKGYDPRARLKDTHHYGKN